MKINEVLKLDEGVRRAFKRVDHSVQKKFRCTTGKKSGKIVSGPSVCYTKKDPKKVQVGRRVMRTKQGVIKRKAKITKRTSLSKLVQRLNKNVA